MITEGKEIGRFPSPYGYRRIYGKGYSETKNFYFKYNNGIGHADHFSNDQCICDKGLFGNY